MRAHTLAPSILPLLEAQAEDFFWNLLEFGHHIRFDVLHGCETRPVEAHFQSREQPKSLRARSVEYGGWVMTGMLLWARNCCTTSDVWFSALSCCFLHHDNAPSHTALIVQQFLTHKSIPVITQPPYSPDLNPNDFWLFPTLKMGLNGMRFTTMEDVKLNATAELQKISKETFHRCFQQWQDQWSKCARVYFEGD